MSEVEAMDDPQQLYEQRESVQILDVLLQSGSEGGEERGPFLLAHRERPAVGEPITRPRSEVHGDLGLVPPEPGRVPAEHDELESPSIFHGCLLSAGVDRAARREVRPPERASYPNLAGRTPRGGDRHGHPEAGSSSSSKHQASAEGGSIEEDHRPSAEVGEDGSRSPGGQEPPARRKARTGPGGPDAPGPLRGGEAPEHQGSLPDGEVGPDPGAAQGRIGKSTGHRVVIVGGGFGGLSCARALEGQPAQVLLLDRHNYHLFTPLLYQVATSLLNPSDIAYPFRAVFRRSRNVRFRQAAVTGVDLKRRVVRTHDGGDVPYDTLVLATGSENDYFANEELAAHTLGMKTLSEAMRLRNHVLACLEIAARAASDEERREWLTFVIAGGGPTGVEYAGALAELLRMVLGRDYPELRPEQARIVVVEGLDRLLGAFHPKLGAYAMSTLRDRGIEVRTTTLVESAGDDRVVLRGGEEIRTRTVVWSAGVRPTDPLGDEAPQRARARRISVDDHLRIPGR